MKVDFDSPGLFLVAAVVGKPDVCIRWDVAEKNIHQDQEDARNYPPS